MFAADKVTQFLHARIAFMKVITLTISDMVKVKKQIIMEIRTKGIMSKVTSCTVKYRTRMVMFTLAIAKMMIEMERANS